MFPKILKKKSVILLIVGVFLCAAVYTAFGFAPVISVDGRRAGLSEFLKVQSAIKNMDMNGNGGVLKLSDEEIKKRVFGNIMDKVFLEEIISKVDTSLDGKADELVRKAIEQNPNLQLDTAARKLYGLTADDFIALVLLPQAKRDLLADRFKNNPEQLNDMWDEMVKNADVKIYYPGYKWEDGEVKKK